MGVEWREGWRRRRNVVRIWSWAGPPILTEVAPKPITFPEVVLEAKDFLSRLLQLGTRLSPGILQLQDYGLEASN